MNFCAPNTFWQSQYRYHFAIREENGPGSWRIVLFFRYVYLLCISSRLQNEYKHVCLKSCVFEKGVERGIDALFRTFGRWLLRSIWFGSCSRKIAELGLAEMLQRLLLVFVLVLLLFVGAFCFEWSLLWSHLGKMLKSYIF